MAVGVVQGGESQIRAKEVTLNLWCFGDAL